MKTADWKRVAPWTKSVSLAVTTFAVALLGTGCNPECVDTFDCRADNGEPPAGQQWVCIDEKCETEPIGQPPVPDAGTPDAGPVDSGTPDSGPVDSGMPDAGPVDSGTPDSGPVDPTPDAGPVDSGTPDAGPVDPTPDAGTPDAGPVTCETTPHDAKLGTLQLQAGFVATETAPLPDGISALGSSPGPTYSFYAVQGGGKDAALYSMGTWPDLQLSPTKLYDVVTPEDRAGSVAVYAGGYLINDGQRVFTGYTTGASGSPGSLSLYDIATPASSSFLTAPKNYSAAAFSNGDTSAVLLNGGGLGTLPTGLGIYGVVTSANPLGTVRVANFPAEGVVASGFTAVADNGVAALGFFNGDFVNVIYGVAPSVVAQAITSGTPLELGSQSPIEVGSDFDSASSFGAGVVVNRGGYDENFSFVSTDVSRFALSTSTGSDTVTVGARAAVLDYVDQCTTVTMLEPLGSDVLVGVADKNGQRLVRLQVAP
ncbi:hypothetical protein FJV41_40705 [Myxococcus llanfairpwllgwyngyllgogerychwyrndrobwllllantysiliogogogochensis]|uniref:Lipoprotein n=1 Tax=Myxococcus llanfairpwllgwyngyllgogerychwyrndrobwllllantysiliogogogochensis TaxID=2590453 RepID=A0A540WME3_9BACT|nr:hypothetical protein [Myxococcus llanfairpwllgwyngyllgogerychwyrndrobwllllantysiliogogogochensis]TQF10186.1 hypothetical protein FJV41_40705 [Myxococcus llanfairpwllgwyngyllgogerychwyrndrobwllllantysiliogogogochensis]